MGIIVWITKDYTFKATLSANNFHQNIYSHINIKRR
jgi:hypothetical protein